MSARLERLTHIHTAIILFSLTAEKEAKRKSFSSNSLSSNYYIAQSLESHSAHEAKKSKLPVFRFSEHNQVGNSFGERLANAIEGVYNRGFQKVIVIGNDCPLLTAQTLKSAQASFSSSSLILGNTGNDGVYLIGLEAKSYSREQFVSLPWCANGLIKAFKNYAQNIGEQIHWEKTLKDLNSEKDIFQFIFEHGEMPLAKNILNVLHEHLNQIGVAQKTPLKELIVKNSNALRAPPVAA